MAQNSPYPFETATDFSVVLAQNPANGWTGLGPSTPRFSLVFVFDLTERKVLLGVKKRGYGRGMIHGFGGKIEAGETMQRCAERELFEESALQTEPGALRSKGRLVFTRPSTNRDEDGAARTVIDIALYCTTTWQGEPQETDEMRPQWYPIDDLPLERMWPDVRLYFPALAQSIVQHGQGEQLWARVEYDFVSRHSASSHLSLPYEGVNNETAGQEGVQHVEAIVGYWLAITRL